MTDPSAFLMRDTADYYADKWKEADAEITRLNEILFDYETRIAELEAALKGCIKTIEDYKIDGPSLRAARAAYLGEKDG